MAASTRSKEVPKSRTLNVLPDADCCGPAASAPRPRRNDARLAALERTFKALADQTRLRILALLSGGEICVCDIQSALGIPQPRTSRHLAYLRRIGLVVDRKDGLWVHYRLADPDDPVLQTLLSGVLHCLDHVDGSAPKQPAPELPLPCCAPVANRARTTR